MTLGGMVWDFRFYQTLKRLALRKARGLGVGAARRDTRGFVDPAEKLSVVAFTNTAFEGMSGGGRFPQDITREIYAR